MIIYLFDSRATDALWKGSAQQYYCVDISKDMHKVAEDVLCGGNQEENKPYLDNVFLRHFLPIGSRVSLSSTLYLPHENYLPIGQIGYSYYLLNQLERV